MQALAVAEIQDALSLSGTVTGLSSILESAFLRSGLHELLVYENTEIQGFLNTGRVVVKTIDRNSVSLEVTAKGFPSQKFEMKLNMEQVTSSLGTPDLNQEPLPLRFG